MKKFLSIFLSAVLCFAFFGCRAAGGSGGENVITIGTTASIEKAVRDEYAFDMLASGVSEIPLVAKSAEGEYSPVLADYSPSEKGRIWTYTVKDGLKWSDGVPVTAEDLAFSFEFEEFEYENLAVSDDKKSVAVELKKANVKALDDMTTLRIRPKHIYGVKQSAEISEQDARITCGPYKLESFAKASGTLIFTRNEYFPQQPDFEKVIYRLFGGEDVMYAALIRGELDFVWNYSQGVSKTYQTVLANTDGIALDAVAASNCPAVLAFNNNKGLFADRRLRFAVSCALDYGKFKEYFGSAFAETPNCSFAPSSLFGYKETLPLENNPVKAAQYMAEAGYEKSGSRWKKGGETAEFSLTVNAGRESHIAYAEFIKNQLEEFGISVVLDVADGTAYNAKTSNKFAGGKGVSMEAAIMGYTAFGMSDFGVLYIDGNDEVQGGAQVFSDTLTRIRYDMANSESLDAYCEAAGRFQDFCAEELPVIALFGDVQIYARSEKFVGSVADGTFGLNNVKTWFSAIKEK